MKNILLISVLLAFMLTLRGANALTVENVSISETGGVVIGGQAGATATEDASASVRSIIRGGSPKVNVSISVETNADGETRTTSVSRMIRGEARESRTGTTSNELSAATKASTTEAFTIPTPTLSEKMTAFLAHIFSLVFFFW